MITKTEPPRDLHSLLQECPSLPLLTLSPSGAPLSPLPHSLSCRSVPLSPSSLSLLQECPSLHLHVPSLVSTSSPQTHWVSGLSRPRHTGCQGSLAQGSLSPDTLGCRGLTLMVQSGSAAPSEVKPGLQKYIKSTFHVGI